MNGDYDKAGTETDLAIKEHPTDAALHEFRALVFFAMGEYPSAAATLYAVLSAGPGWDWTTMSSLYPNVDTYTVQLRALEQYVKQNPGRAEGHFVLAYHYITAPHNDAAIKQHRPALIAHYKETFAKHKLDALVFPTVPKVAIPSNPDASSLTNFLLFIQNTDPGSNAGLPGLTLPIGRGSASGLPIGLELDGPAGSDTRLLAIGMALEKLYGHLDPPKQ